MKPIPNQRQYPRRTAFIIAEYTVKEGTHRDVVKNIGAGGLFVRTWNKIDVGQPIRLQFPLFDFENTIHVSGIVSRIDPMGFAVIFNEPINGLICEEGHFPEIVHEGDR
ncbi:PilZ domain-containing protein [uncultured Desulfosarcina sp.]|uniref:PilZ domain-containing protein n=1 Tax=uncultured Desulfosarcina sp. TaxID=218289 RepID=UPI0029C6F317|nr:PilZ domain-containing protein [uncultured Desulfosarcina sp.]